MSTTSSLPPSTSADPTPSPTISGAMPKSIVDALPRLIQFGNKTAKIAQGLDERESRMHTLFPFVPSASKGLVVPAVCRVRLYGQELLDPCPLPSKQVWGEYQVCKQAQCSGRVDAVDVDECSIVKCADLYIVASATLCLSLNSPELRSANLYLPTLPPHANNGSNSEWQQSLHKQHLDLVASANQPNASLFAPDASQSAIHLGICVPTVPVSTACDPRLDPTAGLYSIVGAPWLVPAPLHHVPRPEDGQPMYPRAMLAYRSTTSPSAPAPSIPFHVTLKHPPVVLRTVPVFHANASWESQALAGLGTPGGQALDSHNVYALVHCTSSGMYLATRAQDAPCASHSECRQNACVDGKCTQGRWLVLANSVHQSMAEYVGSDAAKWKVAASAGGQVDASKTSVFPYVLAGVMVVVYVMATYRSRLVQWWVRHAHKVAGTRRTTVVRELALAPASNLMLQELGEGTGRAAHGQEVDHTQEGVGEVVVRDDGGWVIVDGDTLPRYQAGSVDRTVQLGVSMDRHLPPAFKTVDRAAPETAQARDYPVRCEGVL